MNEMPVWWLGWTFPIEASRSDGVAASWPVGVKGWCTGSGGYDDDAYATWVGRVEARTEDEAKSLVASMYGSLASLLKWRFDPREHEPGWWPDAGRFPRAVP